MDNFAGFLLVLIVIINVYVRMSALYRGVKDIDETERKKWVAMDETQRKQKARSDWRGAWQAYLGGIMAAELVASITVIVLLVKPHSAFVSILLPRLTVPTVLFVALVPWLAMRWNSTAKRAKQYQVYGGDGMIGTIDSIMLMILLGCSFLLFPILRYNWLLAIYIATNFISMMKAWQKHKQILVLDKAEESPAET
ncbi:MAG: hypothetical protein ACKKL5_00345 [Candidatus Komeilibacteria bacterium]